MYSIFFTAYWFLHLSLDKNYLPPIWKIRFGDYRVIIQDRLTNDRTEFSIITFVIILNNIERLVWYICKPYIRPSYKIVSKEEQDFKRRFKNTNLIQWMKIYENHTYSQILGLLHGVTFFVFLLCFVMFKYMRIGILKWLVFVSIPVLSYLLYLRSRKNDVLVFSPGIMYIANWGISNHFTFFRKFHTRRPMICSTFVH